jgi:hypothetical protein
MTDGTVQDKPSLVPLLAALNACMKQCGYVHKGKTNDFHRYRYAGEDDLLEVLRPALVENGIILAPSVKDVRGPDEHGNTIVFVEYRVSHISGAEWPEKIIAVGCGNDKSKDGRIGDKGVFKALTGANKYFLFKLFQIETGDDPERETSREREPDPAIAALQALAADGVASFEMTVAERVGETGDAEELDRYWRSGVGARVREIGLIDKAAQSRIVSYFARRKAELQRAAEGETNGVTHDDAEPPAQRPRAAPAEPVRTQTAAAASPVPAARSRSSGPPAGATGHPGAARSGTARQQPPARRAPAPYPLFDSDGAVIGEYATIDAWLDRAWTYGLDEVGTDPASIADFQRHNRAVLERMDREASDQQTRALAEFRGAMDRALRTALDGPGGAVPAGAAT